MYIFKASQSHRKSLSYRLFNIQVCCVCVCVCLQQWAGDRRIGRKDKKKTAAIIFPFFFFTFCFPYKQYFAKAACPKNFKDLKVRSIHLFFLARIVSWFNCVYLARPVQDQTVCMTERGEGEQSEK